MNLARFIALQIAIRYLFSGNLPIALRVISVLTIGGLMVGTALLLVVLSVFNGFFFLIRDHYKAFDADLRFSPLTGRYITDPASYEPLLNSIPELSAWSPVLEQQAIIRFGEGQHIIRLKGVSPSYREVTDIQSLIRNGTYGLKTQDQDYTLVIGSGVAWRLGINLADWVHPIEVFTLSEQVNDPLSADPDDLIHKQYFFPAGIFSIEQDYDSRFVICDIEAARKLFQQPDGVTAFELKLHDPAKVESVKNKLQLLLGPGIQIQTWYQQHATLNAVLQNEKAIGYLIIAFMLLLVSFNIVGTLSLMILSKQREIGILMTLGASPNLVQQVFLWVGLLMGLFGSGLGLVMGIAFYLIQDRLGIIRFDVENAQSMLIDHFPVALVGSDLLLIGGTVLALALASAWLPARRAAGRSIIRLLSRA
jgi:lipoprotein-releasing system permease protein